MHTNAFWGKKRVFMHFHPSAPERLAKLNLSTLHHKGVCTGAHNLAKPVRLEYF